MSTELIVSFEIDGLHFWPNAPKQYEEFSHPHRHLFKIVCFLPVTIKKESDRPVELWEFRQTVIEWVTKIYGNPAQFDVLSCEGLSNLLLKEFHLSKCYVFEDSSHGAVSYA